MPSILVDIKYLHESNINKLLQKNNNAQISYRSDSRSNINKIGMILILSSSYFDIINKLPKGVERVEYINSEKFINNIIAVYYVIYNIKNKICEIREIIYNQEHLKDIVKSTDTYLPKDVTVWVGIITAEKSGMYIKEGFSYPYKCDRSPLGFKFQTSGLAFIKKNNISLLNHSSIKNKIKYLDRSITDKKYCTIYIRFTPETLKYLKQINQTGDKELSGSLVVGKVIEKNKKIFFELSSKPNSVIYGGEEEVDAVWSRYNFHTHPKKAYENHGVKNGWPSSQDYVGFLDLKNHTIFHTVVTLEGVYIISLSQEFDEDIGKISRKYIIKNYDINHLDNITPLKYIEKINAKKYKGKQLFNVKFMDWNNASEIFPIFFNQTGGKCLVTDETFDISQKSI